MINTRCFIIVDDRVFFLPGCLTNQTPFNQSCYEITSDVKTRQEANALCGPQGHLVDISTEAEQNHLAMMMTESDVGDVWFGLHRNGYTASEGSASLLGWSDGSPLSYRAWDSNGLVQLDTNCIVMAEIHGYLWSDSVDCDKQLGFVCEFDKGTNY